MPAKRSPFPLVGRHSQRERLRQALDSGQPELVAVLGRRRVGKTYLIRHFFAEHLCFEMSGMRDAPVNLQLKNFSDALGGGTGFQHQAPDSWPEAFRELIRYLEPLLRRTGRRAVFFDELPWLASRRSGFLPAFEYFWNSWASRQPRLVVIICGSAASWMITKVLHDKGGLHNRVTRRLVLPPFQLHETEEFLHSRGVRLDRRQVTELQMILGGIPFYLDQVQKGKSAAQNIAALLFAPDAPLRDEFQQLYAALFEHHERHVEIVRALARKLQGLTRGELLAATGRISGGNMSTLLEELETSGFIMRTLPFGREQRESLYRLTDELTLFYLRWLDGRRRSQSSDDWHRLRLTPQWRVWAGYAFENLCLRHIEQIKASLGIAAVRTEISAWRHLPASSAETGAQIDLVIDRADGVINLCDMKFTDARFVISKSYAAECRARREIFHAATHTSKTPLITLVSAAGIEDNEWKRELVQGEVGLNALFER